MAYDNNNNIYYASSTTINDGVSYTGKCFLNMSGNFVCSNDQKQSSFTINTNINGHLAPYYLRISNAGTIDVIEAGIVKYCLAKCSIGYNKIPNFDFNNTMDNLDISSNSSTCNTHSKCIGYSSSGYYKSDFRNPVKTNTIDFYVHEVQFGMKFIQLKGWDIIGGDMSGMPVVVSSASICAYECTVTSGCVGAVWDGISNCWLKSYFNTPNNNNYRGLLLPVGLGDCPLFFIDTTNCVVPIHYNKIPGFEFESGVIGYSSEPFLSCDLDNSCIGYSSSKYYKNDFTNPHVKNTSDFYVHVVNNGMKFAKLQGWDCNGGDLNGMPLSLLSATDCAYRCTVTNGCVGAVWDISSKCWLKAYFNTPSQVARFNMLIPVGNNGCPISYFDHDGVCQTRYSSATSILPTF